VLAPFAIAAIASLPLRHWRNKLAVRASLFLAPGERIQSLVLGNVRRPSGRSDWHVVVVTDREIVVLKRFGYWTLRPPTRVPMRHSRNFHFGPMSGIVYGSFVLDGTKYLVPRGCFKDVASADAALVAEAAPSHVGDATLASKGGESPVRSSPAGWYPDPAGRLERRYWDGNQWSQPDDPSKRSPIRQLLKSGLSLVFWLVATLIFALATFVWLWHVVADFMRHPMNALWLIPMYGATGLYIYFLKRWSTRPHRVAAKPGWYPAPGDSTRRRYWDGSAWTQRFAP
jgi:Protein of unknown function (DUF2510)